MQRALRAFGWGVSGPAVLPKIIFSPVGGKDPHNVIM